MKRSTIMLLCEAVLLLVVAGVIASVSDNARDEYPEEIEEFGEDPADGSCVNVKVAGNLRAIRLDILNPGEDDELDFDIIYSDDTDSMVVVETHHVAESAPAEISDDGVLIVSLDTIDSDSGGIQIRLPKLARPTSLAVAGDQKVRMIIDGYEGRNLTVIASGYVTFGNCKIDRLTALSSGNSFLYVDPDDTVIRDLFVQSSRMTVYGKDKYGVIDRPSGKPGYGIGNVIWVADASDTPDSDYDLDCRDVNGRIFAGLHLCDGDRTPYSVEVNNLRSLRVIDNESSTR